MDNMSEFKVCGLCSQLVEESMHLDSAYTGFFARLLELSISDVPSRVCTDCYKMANEVRAFKQRCQRAMRKLWSTRVKSSMILGRGTADLRDDRGARTHKEVSDAVIKMEIMSPAKANYQQPEELRRRRYRSPSIDDASDNNSEASYTTVAPSQIASPRYRGQSSYRDERDVYMSPAPRSRHPYTRRTVSPEQPYSLGEPLRASSRSRQDSYPSGRTQEKWSRRTPARDLALDRDADFYPGASSSAYVDNGQRHEALQRARRTPARDFTPDRASEARSRSRRLSQASTLSRKRRYSQRESTIDVESSANATATGAEPGSKAQARPESATEAASNTKKNKKKNKKKLFYYLDESGKNSIPEDEPAAEGAASDPSEDELQETLPETGPYQCEICQDTMEAKENFLGHILRLHAKEVDKEVIQVLQDDIRKAAIKAKKAAK